MSFSKHLLLFILVPLSLYMIVGSFYRFMVEGSYIVEYEGMCDPVTESCFVGCTDDECTELYYYTWVQKYAADVKAECGPDVTDCESASVCLPSDSECSVTYCSSEELGESENCDNIDASSFPEEPVVEEGVEVLLPEEEPAPEEPETP